MENLSAHLACGITLNTSALHFTYRQALKVNQSRQKQTDSLPRWGRPLEVQIRSHRSWYMAQTEKLCFFVLFLTQGDRVSLYF